MQLFLSYTGGVLGSFGFLIIIVLIVLLMIILLKRKWNQASYKPRAVVGHHNPLHNEIEFPGARDDNNTFQVDDGTDANVDAN